MSDNWIKLSPQTLDLLKNFMSINASIKIDAGNTIRTMSEAKNLFASANIAENIPVPVAIWDLPRFLPMLRMFAEPEILFEENRMKIRDSGPEKKTKGKVTYWYADPSLLRSVPTSDPKATDVLANVTIPQEDLGSLVRSAEIMGLPDLVFEPNGVDKLRVYAYDTSNGTGGDTSTINRFELEFDAPGTKADMPKTILKVELLKILPGNYEIEIRDKGISVFRNTGVDVTYFIAAKKG
jgi:hypothetical protein